MKILFAMMFGVLLVSASTANALQMFGKEKYGYNLPRYEKADTDHIKDAKLVILAIADGDNFPISSFEQGSVFNKIFSDLKDEINIRIIIEPQAKNFVESVQHMERGGYVAGNIDYTGIKINAIFGAPYKSYLYSRNKDIYPAFFVNNIHVLTSVQKDLDLKERTDLNKYKGVYVKADRIADNVLKDFEALGIKGVENFSDAYEQLLTDKADFIAASYYPSLFKAFELGIRDHIVYSKNPVWKMPLFIRVRPEVMKNKKVEELSRYLKSPHYKKRVKEAFDELVEIYQTNTEGIVPPTYVRDDSVSQDDEENKIAAPEEQMLEN